MICTVYVLLCVCSASQFAFDEREGWDWSFAMMDTSEEWRVQRAMLAKALNNNNLDVYRDTQRAESQKLLANLHERPKEFMDHVKA